MNPHDEYHVRLDVFEGPLDLLLYLIKRDEVDIYDIPIERITREYVGYLDLMKMLDLNIAGDFLVMAATLMMIKSRMLLPVEARSAVEEDEEEADPRWDLVRQLIEYKKFKDAAVSLEYMAARQENIFTSSARGTRLDVPAAGALLEDVSLFDLLAALHEALGRVTDEPLREIFGEQYTVTEKIDFIMQVLDRKERLNFTELFEGMASRQEIVCTFLALLELMRLNQLRVSQDRQRGEIQLFKEREIPA